MTIVSTLSAVAQQDSENALRSLPFNSQREAKALLANPDTYSLSHLTDEQVETVLRVAYGL